MNVQRSEDTCEGVSTEQKHNESERQSSLASLTVDTETFSLSSPNEKYTVVSVTFYRPPSLPAWCVFELSEGIVGRNFEILSFWYVFKLLLMVDKMLVPFPESILATGVLPYGTNSTNHTIHKKCSSSPRWVRRQNSKRCDVDFVSKERRCSWVLALQQNIVSGTNRNSKYLLETDLTRFLTLLKI